MDFECEWPSIFVSVTVAASCGAGAVRGRVPHCSNTPEAVDTDTKHGERCTRYEAALIGLLQDYMGFKGSRESGLYHRLQVNRASSTAFHR